MILSRNRDLGVDPLASSVKTASEHARQFGLNISFGLGVGEAIPFGEGNFDAGFCHAGLEHTRDLPKLILRVTCLKTSWASPPSALNTSLAKHPRCHKVGHARVIG